MIKINGSSLYTTWREYPELKQFSDREKSIVWYNFKAENIAIAWVLGAIIFVIAFARASQWVGEVVFQNLIAGYVCEALAVVLAGAGLALFNVNYRQHRLFQKYLAEGKAKTIAINHRVERMAESKSKWFA